MAFGSTHERALAVPDEEYLRRASVGTTHLAFSGDEPVGIVSLVPDDGDPSLTELTSLWVDPRLRGTGVADRLVEAVCTAGRIDGAREVSLWVTVGNGRARRLYERCGFTPTGRRRSVRPEQPERLEERMRRSLALPSQGSGLVWTAGEPGAEVFSPPPADGGPREGAVTGMQLFVLRAWLGAEKAYEQGHLLDETLQLVQDRVHAVIGPRALSRLGDQVRRLAPPDGDLDTILADPVLCRRLLRGLLADG